VAALVWANCADHSYGSWWRIEFGWPRAGLRMDARHWADDALMTIFFFVIGLELKYELARGSLARPRRALVPVFAAIGGAVVPAVTFLAITWGTDAASGWGIPMATDPAFAVGVLAVLVIAFGYARGVAWGWLAGAAAGCLLVVLLRRIGVTAVWAYLPVGVLVWFATLHSGVHATLAGVALALLTPAGPVAGRRVLAELLRVAGPASAFVAVPIFALANAGVVVDPSALSRAAQAPVTWAVLVALLGGKLLGVTGAIAIAVGGRFGQLPAGVRPAHVLGLGCIAGLGFTVALLVTNLAYTDVAMIQDAKIAIFTASLVATVAAAATFTVTGRRTGR